MKLLQYTKCMVSSKKLRTVQKMLQFGHAQSRDTHQPQARHSSWRRNKSKSTTDSPFVENQRNSSTNNCKETATRAARCLDLPSEQTLHKNNG